VKPGSGSAARFRLDQNFEAFAGGDALLVNCEIRKPGKFEWFRCHPNQEFWFRTLLLELKDERQTFLVDPSLRKHLVGIAKPAMLVLSINSNGAHFWLNCGMPDERGTWNQWHKQLYRAAEAAVSQWVTVLAQAGGYEVRPAEDGIYGEPKWRPAYSLDELVDLACEGDHVIADLSHPVIRRIQGKASLPPEGGEK
jgi:hypothetical protein